MRIIFLTDHLKGKDGWSRYSLDLAEGLRKHGHQILCLTSQESRQDKIEERIVLDSATKFLANPWLSWITAKRINKIIKEFSPEIIHFIAEPYATILPFLNTKNSKTFLTVHGTYSAIPLLFDSFFKKVISKFLSKGYYRKIDKIIAVSHYTKKHCLNYFSGLDKNDNLKNKVIVIGNWIDLNRHRLINLSIKPVNQLKRILFVGAVKRRKGIIQAIDACKYYYEHYSKDFIYEIVGNYNQQDSYYQEIVRKIKDYNLDDKIFLRGRVSEEELEQYYLEVDLFMMLSIPAHNRFEGFGLVFLEANAKGVPCLGSINSGCQEAIQNGITGYLVDPHQPAAVAAKMDLMLNQGKISRKDCLDWAKQNSIKEKIKEFIKTYNSILQR